MSDQCNACAGTAPTHTCESYDPRAAERGWRMVLRAGERRWVDPKLKLHRYYSSEVVDCWGDDWEATLPSADETIPVDREDARLLLRGLLLPQIVEQAREQWLAAILDGEIEAQGVVSGLSQVMADRDAARARVVELERQRAVVAVEKAICETTENAMRRIADAGRELLAVTGEIDDDGVFQGCPQSTMSIADREAIAPWVEEKWRTLSALVGCVGMKTLVCRGCGGDGETAQDVPERCPVCGGSGVEVKI